MLYGKVIVEAADTADRSRHEDSGKFAKAEGVGPARAVPERSCAHFSRLRSLTSLPARVVDIEAKMRRHPGIEKVDVDQGP